MNFLSFLFSSFLFFILVLIQFNQSNADLSSPQTFVRQLKEYFGPMERGEDVHFKADFWLELNGKDYRILYEFRSQKATHRRWASTIKIELLKYESSLWTFNSVFKDDKLYMNREPFVPELAFFKDLMMKGPQMYSLIDKWMQEGNGSEWVEEKDNRVIYHNQVVLFDKKANYQLEKLVDYAGNVVYGLKLLEENYLDNGVHNKLIFYVRNVKLNQRMDNKNFIVDDLHFVENGHHLDSLVFSSRLFLGLWGLTNELCL